MDKYLPIVIALIFHATDILTGFISALKNKDIKSSRMRDGLFKKVGFIFCYLLAFLIDNFGMYVSINLGIKTMPIIVGYAVITEIVSIIENISEINTDLLPNKLLDLFHITNKEENE